MFNQLIWTQRTKKGDYIAKHLKTYNLNLKKQKTKNNISRQMKIRKGKKMNDNTI